MASDFCKTGDGRRETGRRKVPDKTHDRRHELWYLTLTAWVDKPGSLG